VKEIKSVRAAQSHETLRSGGDCGVGNYFVIPQKMRLKNTG